MQKILLLLAAMFMTWTLSAGASDADVAPESDVKLEHAFGIILADYLQESIPADSANKQLFVEGMRQALSPDVKGSAYYYGLLNVLSIKNKLNSMAQMGVAMDYATTVNELIAQVEDPAARDMTPEEANGVINSYIARQFVIVPDTVSRESQQQFLDSIAAQPGARVLPGGTVMFTIEEGEGETCLAGQKVLVSYTGRLSDGSVFDSTTQPVEMIVGGLVPGFNTALQHSRQGGSYRYVIPASQAYGDRGVPGAIPGNALLDFDVTVEKIL